MSFESTARRDRDTRSVRSRISRNDETQRKRGSRDSSHRRRRSKSPDRERRGSSGSGSNYRRDRVRLRSSSRSRSPPGRSGSSMRRTASRGESDFAKLVQVLATIIKTANSKRSNHYDVDLAEILPEFDPQTESLTTEEWLEKVNMHATMYDWDDLHKIRLASLRLKGIAKIWYEGLENSPISWEAFSVAILTEFPGERNFGKLLDDAVHYVSKPGQCLRTYCLEKIKRINRLKLKIPECDIVDFVIQGIHDFQLKINLLISKTKTIGELYSRLQSASIKKPEEIKRAKTKHARDKKQTLESEKSEKPLNKRSDSIFGRCFNCGGKGHRKRDCLEPKRGKR